MGKGKKHRAQLQQKKPTKSNSHITSNTVSQKSFTVSVEEVKELVNTSQNWNGLRGLENLGNTCFFNSVLQNLAQTIPLRSHLVPRDPWNPTSVMNKIKPSEGPVSAALRDFMIHMWLGTGRYYSPSYLLGEIAKRVPRFRKGQQQDSHELLRFLLAEVDTEILNFLKKFKSDFLGKPMPEQLRANVLEQRKLRALQDGQEEPTEEPTNFTLDFFIDRQAGNLCFSSQQSTSDDSSSKKVVSYVESIFGGQLESTVICHSCGHISTTFEPFLDLSLSIPVRFIDEKFKRSVGLIPTQQQSGGNKTNINNKYAAFQNQYVSKNKFQASKQTSAKQTTAKQTSAGVSQVDKTTQPSTTTTSSASPAVAPSTSKTATTQNKKKLKPRDLKRLKRLAASQSKQTQQNEDSHETTEDFDEELDENVSTSTYESGLTPDEMLAILGDGAEEEVEEFIETNDHIVDPEKQVVVSSTTEQVPSQQPSQQQPSQQPSQQLKSPVTKSDSIFDSDDDSFVGEKISKNNKLTSINAKDDFAYSEDADLQTVLLISRLEAEQSQSLTLQQELETVLSTPEGITDSSKSITESTPNQTSTTTISEPITKEEENKQQISSGESSEVTPVQNKTPENQVLIPSNSTEKSNDNSNTNTTQIKTTTPNVDNNIDDSELPPLIPVSEPIVESEKASEASSTSNPPTNPPLNGSINYDVRKINRPTGLTLDACLFEYTEPEVLLGNNGFACYNCTKLDWIAQGLDIKPLVEKFGTTEEKIAHGILPDPSQISSSVELEDVPPLQNNNVSDTNLTSTVDSTPSSTSASTCTSVSTSNISSPSVEQTSLTSSLKSEDTQTEDMLTQDSSLQDFDICIESERADSDDSEPSDVEDNASAVNSFKTNKYGMLNIDADEEYLQKALSKGLIKKAPEQKQESEEIPEIKQSEQQQPSEQPKSLVDNGGEEEESSQSKISIQNSVFENPKKPIEISSTTLNNSKANPKKTSSSSSVVGGSSTTKPSGPVLLKRTATKQFLLDLLPPILTIHINRFWVTSNGSQKLDLRVEFPPVLDLAPYISRSAQKNNNTGKSFKYQLYGVVSHSGSMSGGHYVAYTRRRTSPISPEDEIGENWHFFSDISFSPCSLSNVLGQQAYLLFYERIDN